MIKTTQKGKKLKDREIVIALIFPINHLKRIKLEKKKMGEILNHEIFFYL